MLVCAACPLIEIVCRSSDSIFATGSDMETTLALLFILVELSLLSLRLAARFLPALMSRMVDCGSGIAAMASFQFSVVAPTTSPPMALRI
jgi:hypothetical protein